MRARQQRAALKASFSCSLPALTRLYGRVAARQRAVTHVHVVCPVLRRHCVTKLAKLARSDPAMAFKGFQKSLTLVHCCFVVFLGWSQGTQCPSEGFVWIRTNNLPMKATENWMRNQSFITKKSFFLEIMRAEVQISFIHSLHPLFSSGHFVPKVGHLWRWRR